ncbi:cytochrome PufQ [Nereida sp. MMG025]|uniref:cytochrome PufQ n=1 Tax=Nereida sp. MMG025 TaxID=2909981 RepID=UPI001EEF0CDA|nr:cytochrome PufQ [Nereida sp. MMG025]MCF6445984.1 protein pufQ [Nereida sp. MMG025]
MTDMTSNTPTAKTKHKSNQTEFSVYFAVIFVFALPLATLSWALSSFKSGTISRRGPIARAWSQARIITPMIFTA